MMRMHNKALRTFLVVLAAFQLSGCLESSFTLSEESRLPKWFAVPDGMSRNQLRVTLDYYTDGDAVFKLYDKNRFISLREIKGITRESHPIKLKNSPPGFPPGRPVYEVITANGITDIIEHRKMEPIFYVTDDPAIWQELGVKH